MGGRLPRSSRPITHLDCKPGGGREDLQNRITLEYGEVANLQCRHEQLPRFCRRGRHGGREPFDLAQGAQRAYVEAELAALAITSSTPSRCASQR